MQAKKFFLLVVAYCLIQNFVSAQSQDARIPKVVPPSPNAAALQRYGDIPVSLYTGTPNISIPLYEVKSGDISVPISISYNASGIKVADEASRVGLGWALNAGGVISRSIIGKDDWESYHAQTTFDIPLGPKYDQGSNFNFMYNCLMSINSYSLPQVTLNDQNSDFQPDQYSYNFNGRSGKFVLRRNKDVVLNKTEKIDIRLVDPVNATSWEIKTPDGFIYRFEDIENYVDISTSRKSSWYLSKITSPTGKIVQFIYTAISSNIQPAGSYFESKPIGFLASSSCNPSLPSHYSNTIAGKTYNSLYLSKITFDQGEVLFNYTAGRIDIANEIQLSNVQIYSKKQGVTPNTLLKTWTFNYSYFTGTNFNGTTSSDPILTKRLKLNSVQESSPSASLPPFSFSYNESGTLPAKLSFARDHWGYYNGKVGNTSLIPTFTGGGGGTVNIGTMNNERDADPAYSQMFILTKIQYPTGGETRFEYESNDFDQTASLMNDHSFFATYGSGIPVALQASVSNVTPGGSFSTTLDLSNMYPLAQNVKIEASFINYSTGLTPSQVNSINYSFFNPNGLQNGGGQVGSYLGSGTPPMTEWLGTQGSNSGVKMTLLKSLAPGVYTFNFDLPANVAYAASIVMSYTKAEGSDQIVNSGETVYNALFGGGLRIRKIIDYTDASTAVKVKKYNYHYQLNGKAYSYGKRMAKPNYSYYDLVSGGACSRACLMRESDSNIPLNGSSGAAVAYDKVEELIGENGENGKNVYEYRNQPDVILDYRVTIGDPLATIPLKPPFGGVLSDAGNGNLLKQTTYAYVNGQFVKSNEVHNTYQDLSTTNSSILYGIDKRTVSDQGVPGMECGKLSFYIYPALSVNRHVLTSSVSNLYDVTGVTAPITTTSEYTYDNSTHLQLTSKSEYKSSGDKITTNIKYPADYADPQSDAAILLMKGTAYMHALPVTQQLTLTKGTDLFLTEAQINKYQVINSKVFSKEKAILENTQPININTPPAAYNPASGSYPSGYMARLFYDSYDAAGNITQVHKSGDVSMAFIWDYFSNYPVAEITNATSAICAFTSFESDGTGNWFFSGTPSIDATAFTGSKSYSLTGSNNITKSSLDGSKIYIVSYWSKTGSTSINGGTASAGVTRSGWTYYEHTLGAGTTSITITGSVTIDELRLFPKGSLMTTYTFDPLVGMTSQCDASNKTTYYFYDDFQRLKYIKDQDGNILKTIEYKYKQ